MLTLTRKLGQAIYVDDHIKIIIKEIRRGQVRLGIEAPNGIPIYREEIYNQIKSGKFIRATPQP